MRARGCARLRRLRLCLTSADPPSSSPGRRALRDCVLRLLLAPQSQPQRAQSPAPAAAAPSAVPAAAPAPAPLALLVLRAARRELGGLVEALLDPSGRSLGFCIAGPASTASASASASSASASAAGLSCAQARTLLAHAPRRANLIASGRAPPPFLVPQVRTAQNKTRGRAGAGANHFLTDFSLRSAAWRAAADAGVSHCGDRGSARANAPTGRRGRHPVPFPLLLLLLLPLLRLRLLRWRRPLALRRARGGRNE